MHPPAGPPAIVSAPPGSTAFIPQFPDLSSPPDHFSATFLRRDNRYNSAAGRDCPARFRFEPQKSAKWPLVATFAGHLRFGGGVSHWSSRLALAGGRAGLRGGMVSGQGLKEEATGLKTEASKANECRWQW